jgi:hypothetical protein
LSWIVDECKPLPDGTPLVLTAGAYTRPLLSST